MRTRDLFKAIAPLAMLPLLWGCQPSNPGSANANQPPTTRIVVAPLEGAENDHYVSPEVMFHVQWFGNDPDGTVIGYWVKVDTGTAVWTTRSDSAIAFESSMPDTLNDGKTIPLVHTINVKAVDDQGAVDPTGATRSFGATNYIPTITAFVANFADDATVGPGIAFAVTWNDSNPSGSYFRLWVDSHPVTDWDTRASYQFCKTSDASILNTLDTATNKPLDVSLLANGAHSLTVRVMDWGGAISDSVTRSVTVTDTVKPLLTSISSTYSGLDYYPDGSVFYSAEAPTHFTVEGSAVAYFGGVQAYRYRMVGSADSSDWSAWGAATFDTLNLPASSFRFEAQCRDWAGAMSDVASYAMNIVEPSFSNSATVNLLIVDETFDGNGGPGSPSDAQDDGFWRTILGYDTTSWQMANGWKVSEIDYSRHKIGTVNYVSAFDLHDKNVIIWHGDEKAHPDLNIGAFNIRALSEYLDRGGKLFLCGWDAGRDFSTGGDTSSSIIFSSSSFGGKYLRIASGQRSNTKTFANALGMEGYPNLAVDAAKLPAIWHGTLDRSWMFVPLHRTETIELWSGAPFDSLGCAMKNFSPLNPWRTIVCGFPMYFIVNADAAAFMSKALGELMGS